MTLTPDSFRAQLARQDPAAVYLFLGPELYGRDACRRALMDRFLGPDPPEDAFVRHDLDSLTMAEVLDDARALSLFAPRRVIWVSRAEGALPRSRATAADEESGEAPSKSDGAAQLADYCRNPPPDVVLVFDSSKFEFEGEDKARTERLRKHFAAVPQVVEFARLAESQVRRLAAGKAKEFGFVLSPGALDLLVEATGASALRVETEIEKLSNFVRSRGGEARVEAADIEALVPQARTTTIFALVAALGRKDRAKALELLDTLLGSGEYLPLALGFLATQFRHALAAREAGLRGASQIQAHFQRMGVPMWPSRAEQVWQTVGSFRSDQLERGIREIAATDAALRDTRPDDRTVLEQFVWKLTA
jgi:DNA polymerase-3 subunit delta